MPAQPPNNKQGGQVENVPTLLLRPEENQQVFTLLGPKCKTLATAVVQVYHARSTSPFQWTKMCCGVACFVRDGGKRSFYLRVYSLTERRMKWELELYRPFDYYVAKEFFHCFRTEECWAAFNFANKEEATNFKNVVQNRIRVVESRIKKRKPSMAPPTPQNAQPIGSTSLTPIITTDIQLPQQTKETPKKGAKVKKKDSKGSKQQKKFSKEDISRPSNFQHVSHVGIDPSKTFGVQGDDTAELREYCKALGIPEDKIKENMDFIQSFIKARGGMQAVKKDQQASIRRQAAPHVPPSQPPATPMNEPSIYSDVGFYSGYPGQTQFPSNDMVSPPPLPSRRRSSASPQVSAPPSPTPPPPLPPTPTVPSIPTPQFVPPTPPPSFSPPPPTNTGRVFNVPSPPSVAPIPPPTGVPPPPPPPPPTLNASAVPPPPPVSTIPSAQTKIDKSNRSSLLGEIEAGFNLRPVQAQQSNRSSVSERDALMEQIRGGINLRQTIIEKDDAPPAGNMDGLGAALLDALSQRQRVIHGNLSDDDDDDYDDEDDDEWED